MEYYANLYNYDGFLKAEKEIKMRSRADLELIRKHGKTNGHLLEVGCMYGFFLDEAKKVGFEPGGIEISAKAATYAREELGLDVHLGRLETFD